MKRRNIFFFVEIDAPLALADVEKILLTELASFVFSSVCGKRSIHMKSLQEPELDHYRLTLKWIFILSVLFANPRLTSTVQGGQSRL